MNIWYDFLTLKKSGYRFNKRIFQSAVIIILITAIIAFAMSGFDKSYHIYFKCDSGNGQPCENMFYQNKEYCGKYLSEEGLLCNQMTVPDGFTYGKPAPAIVKDFPYITALLIVAAFLLNHYLYNRKVKFDFEVTP